MKAYSKAIVAALGAAVTIAVAFGTLAPEEGAAIQDAIPAVVAGVLTVIGVFYTPNRT